MVLDEDWKGTEDNRNEDEEAGFNRLVTDPDIWVLDIICLGWRYKGYGEQNEASWYTVMRWQYINSDPNSRNKGVCDILGYSDNNPNRVHLEVQTLFNGLK